MVELAQPSAPTQQRADNVLLTARGLTKVYDTGDVKVQALRGVDLDVLKGELLVMLGASGSGKSTLLNIFYEKASIPQVM